MSKIVYTPASSLRDPIALAKSMAVDLFAARELAWRLLVRNISARYRQTLLGYIWTFLPALATTAVWVFLKSQNIFSVAETRIPYPAYVLTGTLLWQGFVDAVNSPMRVVGESRTMLTKINFPYEALLLTAFGEVLFNFVIRLVLLFFVYAWFHVAVPPTIWLASTGILALLALGATLGTLLVPFGLLYNDVPRGLMLVTSLWFFVTPVVYPVPSTFPATLVARVNPVTPVLVTAREWLTTGRASDPAGFAVVVVLTVVGVFVSWLLYRLSMPHLVERMGS